MKILLLNTPLVGDKITRDMAGGLGFNATSQTLLPPLDLAIMASSLRLDGHKVRIIDPEVKGLRGGKVDKEIVRWKPDVIISSVSLPSIKNDIEFIKNLRKITKAKIIAKTSIDFEPVLKEILDKSKIDFCLLGEGDTEITNIIKGKSERGTVYYRDGKLVINSPIHVDKLDPLPLPARDLLENKYYRYPLLGNNCTTIQTSRGCPFPCAYYCPYPLVQGRKWRAMSPERVIKELVEVVKKYKINKVLFRDATFTLDKERTIKICQKIIKNRLKFSWWCETRVNCLDEELLKIMKKAGCKGANIGVETGDPKVMEIQGKPGVSLAQLENIKKAADKVGIKLHFLLVIGLPEETRHSLYLTFKMIKRLKPYSLGVTVITPYPGTPLYQEAKDKGWIEVEDWASYSGNLPTMHTNNLSPWEMKLAQKMIQGEIFLQKKGILGQIALNLEDLIFRTWEKIS